VAVFTPLEPAELENFLRSYGVGPVQAVEPLVGGIENTSYLVTAPGQRCVVTLYEQDSPEDVAAFLDLAAELSRRGVPCPRPLRGPRGYLGEIRGKPAAAAPFVEGESVFSPNALHMVALGRALATLHLAALDLDLPKGGAHLTDVLCPLARRLAEEVREREPRLAELLESEAAFQEGLPESELPAGLIHADLFLDNVLFQGTEGAPEVSALLDFELAARGPLLFDLAVVLTDAAWIGGGISGERARAFLSAYRSLRPLQALEFEFLPGYLRRAVLRFLCLRLERSAELSQGGRRMAVGEEKSPAELARKLRTLRRGPGEGPTLPIGTA
jgi:homoserine kinase type II